MLFCAIVIVVIFVLGAILSWIRWLETLGANDNTLIKLQKSAASAMKAYFAEPAFGAHIWTKEALEEMRGAPCVRAGSSGYVQQILENVLQEEAEQCDLLIYVAVRTGDYVVEGQPLAYCEALGEAFEAKLRAAFYIRSNHSFEQDPMLGVQVLTEVASRALSPAVNDPQTAVDVISRLSAIFTIAQVDAPGSARCGRVWIIPQDVAEMFWASFDVIARDGECAFEVREALAQSLARIAEFGAGKASGEAKAALERLKLV